MTIDELRRVLIVGTGGIGRQIAISCASSGYAVTLYDVSAEALQATATACQHHLQAACVARPADRAQLEQALADLRVTQDPQAAGHDADLLIESIPEQLPLKRAVFAQFAAICPAHTLFTTNSSIFLPSMFIGASGRPDKLAALHFIMGSDLTEIMPQARTSKETVQLLEQFSQRIGHLVVHCKKEQPGHLVSTMLMALNNAALTLAANGVAEPEDIDRAWMKATHHQQGPFGFLDLVGLKIALEITEHGMRMTKSPQIKKNAEYLQQKIAEGRLGKQSGWGFYHYPNPAFEDPGFLAGQ